MKNSSDKLLLINFWSTGSDQSKKEFPEFITINRMYRDRDFEFISIYTDEPAGKDKVLKFLQLQQASMRIIFSMRMTKINSSKPQIPHGRELYLIQY